MPKLGVYTEDMLVAEWLVSEGAEVAPGTPVFVLESDKTTAEVEAEDAGYLHRVVDAGALVPIGAQVGVVATTLDEYRALAGRATIVSAPAAPDSEQDVAPVALASPSVSDAPRGSRRRPGIPMISPRARALLARQGRPIDDARAIRGTGPGGRITHRDVAAYLDAVPAAPADAGPTVTQRIPLRGTRGTIARRMVESLQTAAQLTSILEIEVSQVLDLRRRAAANGSAPGITAIFVAVVAEALRRNPLLNARVVGDEIEVLGDINIGVAVETAGGVVVPVVHHAQALSIAAVQSRLTDLVERARSARLEPADVADATFTLSNGGIHPVDLTTAILNPPQCALLWIGRIRERPVVTADGGLAVRPTLQACLTFDHRAVDGGPAAALLGTVEKLIGELHARNPDDEPGVTE